jgi:hypothetical protein
MLNLLWPNGPTEPYRIPPPRVYRAIERFFRHARSEQPTVWPPPAIPTAGTRSGRASVTRRAATLTHRPWSGPPVLEVGCCSWGEGAVALRSLPLCWVLTSRRASSMRSVRWVLGYRLPGHHLRTSRRASSIVNGRSISDWNNQIYLLFRQLRCNY